VLWTINAKPLARFHSPMMRQYEYLYYVRPTNPAPRAIPACR